MKGWLGCERLPGRFKCLKNHGTTKSKSVTFFHTASYYMKLLLKVKISQSLTIKAKNIVSTFGYHHFDIDE